MAADCHGFSLGFSRSRTCFNLELRRGLLEISFIPKEEELEISVDGATCGRKELPSTEEESSTAERAFSLQGRM